MDERSEASCDMYLDRLPVGGNAQPMLKIATGLATLALTACASVRRHHEFDMHRPFKVPGVTESLYRGLRLAGLPE